MKTDFNILKILQNQLQNNFLLDANEQEVLNKLINEALLKTENCFKNISNKYYFQNNEVVFNPYHSGQYTIFLYFFSRIAFENEHRVLADKMYYLNKMLNGCDLFYEVKLPDIFMIEHPIGSVIGRGTFDNYFVFQQNCTIGGNKGQYPKLGKYVWMHANSSIIGNCKIGNNVFIAANTLVKDENIPDNTIVFGASPNLILKSKPIEYFLAKSQFTNYC